MKLTKEECIEYLETLKNFACLNATCCRQTLEEIKENKKLFNECINYFEQLIKEHFDDPSLKDEEIKKLAIENEHLKEIVDADKKYVCASKPVCRGKG